MAILLILGILCIIAAAIVTVMAFLPLDKAHTSGTEEVSSQEGSDSETDS